MVKQFFEKLFLYRDRGEELFSVFCADIPAKAEQRLIDILRSNVLQAAASTVYAAHVHSAELVKGKIEISVSSLFPLEARPLKADILTSLVFLLLPLIIHAQIAGVLDQPLAVDLEPRMP